MPPLSQIARWYKPLASGDALRMLTDSPPADSPKMVTQFGIAAELRDVVP